MHDVQIINVYVRMLKMCYFLYFYLKKKFKFDICITHSTKKYKNPDNGCTFRYILKCILSTERHDIAPNSIFHESSEI